MLHLSSIQRFAPVAPVLAALLLATMPPHAAAAPMPMQDDQSVYSSGRPIAPAWALTDPPVEEGVRRVSFFEAKLKESLDPPATPADALGDNLRTLESHTYDANGRLQQVATQTQTWTVEYNADGRKEKVTHRYHRRGDMSQLSDVRSVETATYRGEGELVSLHLERKQGEAMVIDVNHQTGESGRTLGLDLPPDSQHREPVPGVIELRFDAQGRCTGLVARAGLPGEPVREEYIKTIEYDDRNLPRSVTHVMRRLRQDRPVEVEAPLKQTPVLDKSPGPIDSSRNFKEEQMEVREEPMEVKEQPIDVKEEPRETVSDDSAVDAAAPRFRLSDPGPVGQPVLGQGMFPTLTPDPPGAGSGAGVGAGVGEEVEATAPAAEPTQRAEYDEREVRESFDQWEFDDRGNWVSVVRTVQRFRNGELEDTRSSLEESITEENPAIRPPNRDERVREDGSIVTDAELDQQEAAYRRAMEAAAAEREKQREIPERFYMKREIEYAS